MKWLTREWQTRGMSDPAASTAWDAYSQHLTVIFDELQDGVDFLVSKIRVEGALVDKYDYKSGVLELVLMTGSETRGYEWVTLHFRNVTFLSPEPKELGFLIHKPTELLHDEVDLGSDGGYEYRVLCWPQGELIVRFGQLEVDISPATAEERATFY